MTVARVGRSLRAIRTVPVWLLILAIPNLPRNLVKAGSGGEDGPRASVEIRVPLNARGEIDLAVLVERLAERTGIRIERPRAVNLPASGLAGALDPHADHRDSRPRLVDRGPRRRPGRLLLPELLDPANLARWSAGLRSLSERATREAERRGRYGFRVTKSYHPNDPESPTVCLVHGLNSNAGSFLYIVPMLEEAGFGVVLYDFPDNQDLDITVPEFLRDWKAFRMRTADRRPWAVVTHSMGALIARAYVEGEEYGRDVSDLILIGPPNQGASIARVQTILQLIEGTQAIQNHRAGALAVVGEGLGASAKDLEPGSEFLKALNARPRREGVRYHILAGDDGFLSARTRRDIEKRLSLVTRGERGSQSTGPPGGRRLPLGARRVERGDRRRLRGRRLTRLEDAPEPVVIHANHVALIRGPLLFPDPGPVDCMPYVLRWLEPLRKSRVERKSRRERLNDTSLRCQKPPLARRIDAFFDCLRTPGTTRERPGDAPATRRGRL